ncbi:MAG: hypothetical protein R3B84_09860 [Zavarzinella sp.]
MPERKSIVTQPVNSAYVRLDQIAFAVLLMLICARPMVPSLDPGQLQLSGSMGSVWFAIICNLLLVVTAFYQSVFRQIRLGLAEFTCLGLLLLGVVTVYSGMHQGGYLSPAIFQALEWYSLGCLFLLVRLLADTPARIRTVWLVLLATIISQLTVGAYQAWAPKLKLPSLTINDLPNEGLLVGDLTAQWYPTWLTAQINGGWIHRLDTLLMFSILGLILVLPLAQNRRFHKWLFRFLFLGIFCCTVGLLSNNLPQMPTTASLAPWKGQPMLGIGVDRLQHMNVGSDSEVAPTAPWLIYLLVSTGIIGALLLVLTVISTWLPAWAKNRPAGHVDSASEVPKWNCDTAKSIRISIYAAGTLGLLMGLLWQAGQLAPEQPPKAIETLGMLAAIGGVVWFLAVALLEQASMHTDRFSLHLRVFTFVLLLAGLIYPGVGHFSLLAVLVICWARAGNMDSQTPTRRPTGAVRWLILGIAMLGLVLLLVVGLPLMNATDHFRFARLASFHLKELHRGTEGLPPGPLRTTRVATAHDHLQKKVLLPLKLAEKELPGNAPLQLELARIYKQAWEYELILDPTNAAKTAELIFRHAELAIKADPQCRAAQIIIVDSLFMMIQRSTKRLPERIKALQSRMPQLEQLQPMRALQMNYQLVILMLENNLISEVVAMVDHLIDLHHRAVAGGKPGLSKDEIQRLFNQSKERLTEMPDSLLKLWTEQPAG